RQPSPVRALYDRYVADPASPMPRLPTSSSFPNLKQPPSKNVSIIVPAYNEEERLPKMLDLTFGYLDSLKVKDKTFTYEVVVVDDGSTDQTAEVV
ncbi:unnamed protein product, partial [Chrysoparadoxa australica]